MAPVTITVGVSGDYTSIAAAIAAASTIHSGEAEVDIVIEAGTWTEDLTISRSGISLIGANAAFNAGEVGRGAETLINGVILVTGDDTSLTGLMIQPGGTVWAEKVGVMVSADDVTISNSVFEGAGYADGYRGIMTAANAATGLTVEGSSFVGLLGGVYVNPGMADLSVTGNSFVNNGNGMNIDGPGVTGDVSGNSFVDSVGSHIGMGSWTSGTINAGALVGENSFAGSSTPTSVFGTGGNDEITGTGAVNAIYAEGGNDTIHASAEDRVYGGAGTDVVILDEGTTAGEIAGMTLDSVEAVGVAGAEGTTWHVSAGMSIQAAIDAAAAGDTIVIGDGTFAENLLINKAGITLTSANGRGATTIVGSDASGLLGTIEIDPGMDGVTINGLTILGINGNGAVEKAAIYIQGANTGLTVTSNEIVARGDAGLMSEYGQNVSDAVIFGNIFSGKTFVGANPESSINNTSSIQFDIGNDFPRQLVVMGNGGGAGASVGSNITFTNNQVTGTTGGISSVTGLPLGNNLVTIDVSDSSIIGNSFTGFTGALTAALRARRDGIDIEDNTFDLSQGGQFAFPASIFVQNNTTGSISGNSFINALGAHVFAGTASNDVLVGTAGDDIFLATAGNDTLDGAGGTDTLDMTAAGSAGSFVDLASGLAFSSTTGIDTVSNIENVIGSSGNDGLFGDTGDNVFTASAGTDQIDGRGGNDSYDASAATTDMQVNLSTGAVSGAHTATLANVENVATGSGDDVVNGSAAANVIATGAGNDTITASAGADTIDGGSGTDTVSYGAASVTIGGGTGAWAISVGGDTQTVSNVEIVTDAGGRTLLVGNGGFASIQEALNAAQANDTILIAEGTYAGGFTIATEGLTIKAVGDVVIAGNFRQINGIAEGASVAEWLQGVAGYNGSENAAITVAASGVTLEGLVITNYNIGVALTTSIDDLALTDLDISSGITGIRKSTAATIDGLTITGGSFTDMQHGMTIYKASNADGRLSNFTVDGSSFSNLNEKGIYLETGDHVLMTNLTMTDVGEFGRTQSFGGTGTWGTGIDVNLKFSSGTAYQDIEISDSTFTNVGTSDQNGAGSPHLGGAAISVKTRDDGGSYGPNPATFDGELKIDGVTIDGTSVGIRVGEPGQTNAGPAVDVTGTSITNAVTAELDNRSASVITVELGDGGEVWAAAPTTTGAIDFAGGTGADDMTGGAGADTFAGGGGDDSIDGGAGLDTVTFTGNASAYTITWNGTTATVSDGTSTVSIENAGRLDFADKDVLLVAVGGEFATIQSAVTAAANGDEVLIAEGHYAENINIADKSITLTGADGESLPPSALGAPAMGVVIAGQISTSGLMAEGDELRFANLTIDAAGQQYGLFLRNSATDVAGVNAGTIALHGVTIQNAAAQGMFYANPANGSTPLSADTVGNVSIMYSTFLANGEVYSGARGHGHVNLFGFNGNLTVDGTSFTSSTGLGDSSFRGGTVSTNGAAANADKALSVTGIRTGTAGVGGYADAGSLVLSDITVEGDYSSDVLSFYTIGNFAGGITLLDVSVNARALWSLINFDSVSGPIDLSSGFTGTNTSLLPTSRVGELQGLATADVLTGTDGVDILFGRGGADTMSGGDGNDIFVYTDAAQFVTGEQLDGGDGIDTVLFSGTGTLVLGAGVTNVEQAMISTVGGAGLDASALSGGITLQGGIGADTLTGGAGADTILGGDGNDLIVYANGSLAAADSIDGGVGNDTISFTGTSGVLVLGPNVAGIEVISIATNADVGIDASAAGAGLTILGQDGANTLTGTAQADSLNGGGGDDVLVGGGGNDTLNGSDGFDTADYGATTGGVFANLLLGTAFGTGIGNDTLISIEALKGGSGNDALVAGNGGNLLDGGAGNDTLTGGTGNDTLVARAGNDMIYGGGGSDTVLLDGDWLDFAISQSGGTITLTKGGVSVAVSDVESFVFDDGTVALADLLNVAPDDITFGNGTPEILENEAGAEVTTVSASDPNAGDTVTLSVNDNRFEIVLIGGNYVLKLKDTESLDHETAGTVTVTITATDAGGLTRTEDLEIAVNDVNEAPVVTYPGLGIWEATVEAGAIGAALGARPTVTDPEDDTLSYTLVTGPAAGRLLVGGIEVTNATPLTKAQFDAMVYETTEANGVYTAQFTVSDGTETTALDAQFTVVAGVATDLDGTAGADTLDGASGNDIARGRSGDDLLYGGSGDDTLLGVNGMDTLYGGTGRDRLYGGNGADALYGGDDADRLDGGAGDDQLFGGAGNDRIDGGANNDVMHGGEGNDTMDGGLGSDQMFGGDGNDVLSGGDGIDTLEGGLGADTFVLNATPATYGSVPRMHITDFEQGTDKIDLSAYGLTFIGGAAFSATGGGEVRYSGGATDMLIIDFDGDGGRDYRIQLYSGVTLTADDLIL